MLKAAIPVAQTIRIKLNERLVAVTSEIVFKNKIIYCKYVGKL